MNGLNNASFGFFSSGGGGGCVVCCGLYILGSAPFSTIRCAVGNTASANYSASLGGCLNAASGVFSFAGGGGGCVS